jgi:deaminated glutathione amidase
MLRVGLIQMTSGLSPDKNAADASRLARHAAAQGAQLILTPEMTGLLDNKRSRMMGKAQDESGDASLAALQAVAHDTDTWILLGSVPILLDDKCVNRSFLINNQGSIVARYDKIHRFDANVSETECYRESHSYHAGNKAVLATTPWGNLGLTICYDLRFAQLYRRLAQNGASIITVPAAFTKTTGTAHWHVLLRARAIETGCFILAPAQNGEHEDGRSTFGHSLIVSPWGDIIADANTKEHVLIADIDLTQVEEARKRLPSITHDREFDLSLM